MKVFYKKSIFEKIDEAVTEAKRDGKQIEKIVLTDSEWFEFRRCLSRKWDFPIVPEI